MSERRIDPDVAEPQIIRERIIERESPKNRKDAIYDALIVAAILALVASVWTLSQTVTRIDVKQASDEKQLDGLSCKVQGVNCGAK